MAAASVVPAWIFFSATQQAWRVGRGFCQNDLLPNPPQLI